MKNEDRTPLQKLAENLWSISYPLKLLGADIRKNVTVIRLQSGRLLIHSSGPFTPSDQTAIRALGQPTWLADVMLRHDTFSKEALTAFPGIAYLGPEGFSEVISYPTQCLIPPPPEWSEELTVLELQGVPSKRETVIFHRPSLTLIVADLAMNFPNDQPIWQELLLKLAVGKHHAPGISRSFTLMAKDEAALKDSIAQMMTWDFDRLIVGHGSPILSGAKTRLAAALAEAKLV
jgi:hypothetical protein